MTNFNTDNQRLTNTNGIVALLEVKNPAFTAVMRIADDTVDVVSNGDTYIGLPFGFKLPDDVNEQAPSMTLVMNNVGRALSDELERVQPGTDTFAKLMLVSRATPDVIEHTFWLPIVAVTTTPLRAEATASVTQILQKKACKVIANSFTLPGLY